MNRKEFMNQKLKDVSIKELSQAIKYKKLPKVCFIEFDKYEGTAYINDGGGNSRKLSTPRDSGIEFSKLLRDSPDGTIFKLVRLD